MEKEIKTVYIDSRGGEHIIAEMPGNMVYSTVVKYGRENLTEMGYDLLVERFQAIMNTLDIRKQISEMEEKSNG